MSTNTSYYQRIISVLERLYKQSASASVIIPTLATETTLAAVLADTNALVIDVAAIEVLLTNIDTNISDIETLLNNITGNTRTPSFTRVTGAGSILTGAYFASVMNVGGANGTLLGSTLKPGESIPFPADSSNTLSVIAYDATGTEFIISEVR